MTKLSAYFDAFRSLDGYLEMHSASLISSEKMEKALFCDGKTVFLSDDCAFLKAHEGEHDWTLPQDIVDKTIEKYLEGYRLLTGSEL